MRLCFGIFAKVINLCRNNILQAPLIARIVMCIDPENTIFSYNIAIINQINDYDTITDTITDDFICNEQTISKLLACRITFAFSNRKSPKLPQQDIVVNRFENLVAPYIDEDKKGKIILTLLNIIKEDESIDFEKKENFKNYLGMEKQDLLQQTVFIFSDFMARILLYTLCSNIDNRVGIECAKTITDNYIEETCKSYEYEYQWDTSSQTLTLPFAKMFLILNQAIHKYQITEFVEKVDPTNYMEDKWLDNCECFLKYITENIRNRFQQELKSWTLQKIQEFAQTLNEYTDYLGIEMRPIAEQPNYFVPKFRDENIPWALNFAEKITNYRQKLISIYQEIYKHMIFAS